MSIIDRDALLKAAEAVRARAASPRAEEMSELELEQMARRSPLWATVPNAPGPGETVSVAFLEALLRNFQIAEALGIEG